MDIGTIMESLQAVRAVNCPSCGEIIKVVCPRMNCEPTRVKAVINDKNKFIIGGHERSESACTECGEKLKIQWFFD